MVDLAKTAEFCDLVFTALYEVKLLPHTVAVSEQEIRWWPQMLAKMLSRKELSIEQNYLEWFTKAGKNCEMTDLATHQFFALHQWIKTNADFFTADNLRHLRKSIDGRAFQYIFMRLPSTITVAEAERRWQKQNLRQNAKGRLIMWQDRPGSPWMTTTREMEKVFGTEPKDGDSTSR